jgi:hypothetical protein
MELLAAFFVFLIVRYLAIDRPTSMVSGCTCKNIYVVLTVRTLSK